MIGHFGNNAIEIMKKKEYEVKKKNLKKLIEYLTKTKDDKRRNI